LLYRPELIGVIDPPQWPTPASVDQENIIHRS
jgi:hypothetical protein